MGALCCCLDPPELQQKARNRKTSGPSVLKCEPKTIVPDETNTIHSDHGSGLQPRQSRGKKRSVNSSVHIPVVITQSVSPHRLAPAVRRTLFRSNDMELVSSRCSSMKMKSPTNKNVSKNSAQRGVQPDAISVGDSDIDLPDVHVIRDRVIRKRQPASAMIHVMRCGKVENKAREDSDQLVKNIGGPVHGQPSFPGHTFCSFQ